jgi:predicted permease
MTPEPRLPAATRLAIALLPRRFRQEYGDEIAAAVVESRQESAARGRRWRVLATLRTAANLLRTAIAERWSSSYTAPPPNAPRDTRGRGDHAMPSLRHDLRHALRGALRRPGYSLLVAGTLALGIGTSTAIFTVVHGVLLQPLPFREAERLLRVYGRFDPESGFDFPQFSLSAPEYLDYRAGARTMSAVGAYRNAGLSVSELEGGPEFVRGAYLSPEVLPLLGVDPVLGRAFTPEEGRPGGADVILVSSRYWQERFGGAPPLGHTLRVDGLERTVVGVLPETFRFPRPDAQLWLPLVIDEAAPGHRASHGFEAVARLRPDATLATAEAEMRQLMDGWRREFPDMHTGHYLFLRPLHQDTVGAARTPLLTLLLASGLVLLIVCANVASMVLARGEERGREIAVRASLGAARSRLVTLLLTEGLALAAVGGLLGVLFARFLVRGLLALEGGSLPRAGEVAMHPAVLAFALCATLGTAILFTLPPALHATGALHGKLAENSLRGTDSRRRVVFRQGLVAAEVALCFLLVLGAALLVRSLGELLRVDPGYATRGVLVANVTLPRSDYPESQQVTAFARELLERVRALPGVEHAGVSSWVPLRGGSGVTDFELEGRQSRVDSVMAYNAVWVTASEGYFEALGKKLVAGRLLEPADRFEAEPVAVVDEEFVRRFLPDADPLRQRLRLVSDNALPWARIVGVVADGRGEALDKEPMPTYYLAYDQTPLTVGGAPRGIGLVVGANGDPATLVPALRDVLGDLAPDLPLIAPETMTALVEKSTARQRFTTVVLALFAAVSLLLGASGVYGVLAFAVAQRRREIGVRAALGARPAQVLGLVVRQGLAPVWIGLLVGAAGSLALGRALAGLLYGVTPTDPTTWAGVAAGTIAVAVCACCAPAVRALRVDPTRALRAD